VPAAEERYAESVRIIARHLLAEFVRTSAAVLLGLLVMWTAADVLLHVDELAGHLAAGMREVALRVYPVLPIAVPISCVAGVVLCLTRAARNRELTAIQTGGIRLRAALAPILLACGLVAVALGVLEDQVLLPWRATLEQSRSEEGRAEIRLPERLLKRWWFASPNSIFSAATYDAKERVLRDVTVFLFDDQRAIQQRIDAKSAASLDGDTWEIRDAHVLEFPPQGGIGRRSEASLRLDLGITSSEMERAAQTPSASTLHQLARQIRKSAGDAAEVAKLELAFHSRLAQPLSVLIVVLLALPFATGDSRGESLPRALLRSLFASAAFFLLWTLALLTAQSGVVAAPLPVWGVTGAALLFGYWRFSRIPE
jgi:lipopolysaccharide export system permease protein